MQVPLIAGSLRAIFRPQGDLEGHNDRAASQSILPRLHAYDERHVDVAGHSFRPIALSIMEKPNQSSARDLDPRASTTLDRPWES